MGSSYFGEPNVGNERGASSSSSSSSSSRKGKKGSNSEKPKQPQRGLGVAQLEKIRLQGPVGCTYHHHPSLHGRPFPSNFNQEDMRVQTLYSSMASSPSSSSSTTSASYGFHPTMMDSPPKKSNKQRSNSLGSSSQNCESTQELDLELRLSL
ncbi:hypothetical protein Gotri_009244 [Gossypium trilobum]|uniref:Uncharacterized protein n=1 Tax=Gossypium trilobum TaxID=34281 RepID=A0A7J9ELU1_9ROSI|nr:hypothetical protein [Gossypium trilobum]